ncbi:PadR family transcriptional regulator [Actinocorallia sp. A-T 12471]|uniref:PadR family transcriptional regulator n=1 Tax=Actinocorallia sp. A-T 12471 TaxID=3089813 RepID=UPI0029CCF160|nr:helix-turn-helix transcriptional regulator [Actinocorallia sp. A-T 12471]MDX6739420.1 helix-turn-helix transcriptional regulator [Actinocorallia sp. A-T 12471]
MKADSVRGHLDALLLAALETGPAHGYAIITAVEERSAGALELRKGTVYPALIRLERVGLLRSAWEASGERRRRRYELTEAGRRALAGERASWLEFTTAIDAVLNPRTAS